MEDSIYLSQVFAELYSGKHDIDNHIPVHVKIDSKTLFNSLNSSKQVEEKTIRHLIAWMKEQKETKAVENISWVSSQDMLADVFTKKNANSDNLLSVINRGQL